MKIQICISLCKKYNLLNKSSKKSEKLSKPCKALFIKHTTYSENRNRYWKQGIKKKKTKILQDIVNSIIANLKFQHKPKYNLSKILI